MEQTKNSNILKAVLMCILACLGGGLVFGIIYYIGYYVYYITALEIVFGVLAFLNFKKSTSKGTITIGIILSTLFVVLFNFVSVFVCDAISLCVDPEISCTFGEAINLMIDLWKTEPEMAQYFNQRLLEIGGMAILGCVIAIFIVLSNIKKNKEKQTANVQNQSNYQEQGFVLDNQQSSQEFVNLDNTNQSQKQNDLKIEAQNTYFEYFSQCKSIADQYYTDKDMSTFKEKINNLKLSVAHLPADLKENISVIIKNEKSIQSLSEKDKKILEILDRMFI